MKRVFICAPLAVLPQDVKKARAYAAFALAEGAAPILPHFYANLTEGTTEEKINAAQKAALSLLWMCDECWVFGTPTAHMEEIMHYCRSLNIKLQQFDNDENGGIV